MITPILLPAIVRFLGAYRQFLTIADGRKAVRGDAERLQIILGGLSAFGAEGNIIFLGAAVVAMALDLNVGVGIFFQPIGVTLKDFTILRTHGGVIVIEMDIAERPALAIEIGRASCR